MMIRNALLLVLLLCSACASKPPPGAMQLNTRITDDGLKLFELMLPRVDHAAPAKAPQSAKRRPTPGPSDERVLAFVTSVMEQSQYCRAGFVLLGRYAGETTNRVRGECKDRATEEDRDRYPDTIARW